MQGQRYTNGVLTAIAGLLGLHLVGQMMDRGAGLGPGIAVAEASQPEQYRRDGAATRPAEQMDPTQGGLISAAEQRKIMISELRNLGTRLAAIETKLGSGVSVSVTDMPAIDWPAQQASAPAPEGLATAPAVSATPPASP